MTIDALNARWGDHEALIASVDDLDAVVATVRTSGQPTMVFLEAANGTVMAFGAGQVESVLMYAEPDGTSFHSVGDVRRAGYLHFLCRDQRDQFMLEMAIPEADALVAGRQFLTIGQRPSSVRWEATGSTRPRWVGTGANG